MSVYWEGEGGGVKEGERREGGYLGHAGNNSRLSNDSQSALQEIHYYHLYLVNTSLEDETKTATVQKTVTLGQTLPQLSN